MPGPPIGVVDVATKERWPVWAMLAALTSTFALSQAFRTLPAIVAGRMAGEFGASPQAIGIFAAAFAIAFGTMQLFVGVGLDRFGPKRTLCVLFPFAIMGCAVSAVAPTFGVLIAGQILIGIASAPAYLSTLIFIVKRYPASRFAALSGLTMSLGGVGMLITSTPLAWVVQTLGWRSAFVVLGLLSVVSFAACLTLLRDREQDRTSSESFIDAMRGIGPIFRMPQTAGILCLGGTFYGVFLAVRTPWIVPLFETRYGFSLVDAGNVILMFSLAMVFSPLVFGRLDPGGRGRRKLIIALTYVMTALVAALGLGGKAGPLPDLLLALCIAAVSGVAMLEYPDARSSYPAAVVGRAIALLNMSMFFGVAIVQWLAGVVASLAVAHGAEPIGPIFFSLAALLAVATTAYWVLPWPAAFDSDESARR